VAQGHGAQGHGGPAQPASPEEIAETLRGYAREGLSHVQLWLSPTSLAGLEWFKAVLDLLDRGEA
jgi:hypothetical protein